MPDPALRCCAFCAGPLPTQDPRRITCSKRCRQLRSNRARGMKPAGPRIFEHGTLARSRRGCTCAQCREAARTYRYQYRPAQPKDQP